MKKIFFIFSLFYYTCSFSQVKSVAPQFVTDPTKDSIGYSIPNIAGVKWLYDSRIINTSVAGGPITTLPTIGFNPGAGISASKWIANTFYGSQSPTASLTGGNIYELTTSNQTHNLNWTYGRQSATVTIATVVINPGSFNVFSSQPSQPGTISGTQSVTTTANTNTTYTLTVTTTDSKTATSTTTDTFLPRFYYGRCAGSTPTTTEILAFAGGNNPLTGSHAIGPVTITASGSKWPFFSYPASEGFVTIIKDVNGFDVTSAFVLTTVSLTNTSGYTQAYNIYTLNAATASNYTITTN
jgi:hypothetical protein